MSFARVARRISKELVYLAYSPAYWMIGLFQCYQRINQDEILILKLDAIGDYILFRNFLEVLKKHPKFKNHKITLCGNSAFKGLAIFLDGRYVDNFVWIDRKKFAFNLKYRWVSMRLLCSRGYDYLIQPTFSRDFYFEDYITKHVSAFHKIGIESNLINISVINRWRGNNYYSKLINTGEGVTFEFKRYKKFFEKILNENIDLKCTQISTLNLGESNTVLPRNYVILFIGASKDFRKWPLENFALIAKYLTQKGYSVLLCGGPGDLPDAQNFLRFYNGDVTNLVGKTTLEEFVRIISKATFMISNETSAPHLAVALSVPTIVLSNGNHFGRFTPYPKDMTNKYFPIYPTEIRINDFEEMVRLYSEGSDLPISSIEVSKVIDQIEILELNLS